MTNQVDLDQITIQIHTEMERANSARAAGNEGRARVCARRAAGWAGAVHYYRTNGAMLNRNAYDQLIRIHLDEDLPEGARQAAYRLTARITEDHLLPFPEDPLADAQFLIGLFLDETS